MIVELDEADQELARDEAAKTLAYVNARGAHHRHYGTTERDPAAELAWVGSEIAVARGIGDEWVPSGGQPRYTGDIVTRAGEVIEVRWRNNPRRGLPLHGHDDLDRYYFLAVGDFPIYRLAGWLPGRIADLRATRPDAGWKGNGRVVEQPRLWPVDGWIRGYPVTGPAARRPGGKAVPDREPSRGPLDDELDRVSPDWRPCPFCANLPPTDPTDVCPRCLGEGRIDTNPATAPIPF